MSDRIDLNELRRLLATATPGPWTNEGRYFASGDPYPLVGAPDGDFHSRVADCAFYGAWGDEQCHVNAALIAAAVNALPALLAVVDAARAVQAAELAGRAAGKARDDDGIIAALAAKDQAEERLYAALAALDGGPTP